MMAVFMAWPAAAQPSPHVERGYRLMYALQFDEADGEFAALEASDPSDPLATASRAANVLFRELDRLSILQTEFFRDNSTFRAAAKQAPDPRVRARFESFIDRATSLAARRLALEPRNTNALFARTLVGGLQADYASLVEHRNMAALSYTKDATRWANALLSIAPDYYDAYLATGIAAYIIGSLPGPLRLLLRIGGYHGDKERGVKELEIAAERGRLLAPFARILLAVASVRSGDEARARMLLAGLARDFPSNPLFLRELRRLSGPGN